MWLKWLRVHCRHVAWLLLKTDPLGLTVRPVVHLRLFFLSFCALPFLVTVYFSHSFIFPFQLWLSKLPGWLIF